MRLYIIRHGETSWNAAGRLQGHTDIPLNENGVLLAKITAESMKNIPFDYMISSPLNRAYETGRLIMEKQEGVPVILDERIQEIGFGEWEGESSIGNSQVIPSDYIWKFHHTPLECERPPGGESIVDVCVRTEEFYRELVSNPEYEDKTILLATHGCASRCILRNVYEDKEDIWRGSVPPNCAVSIVDVKNGEGSLVELDHIYYDKSYVVDHYKQAYK